MNHIAVNPTQKIHLVLGFNPFGHSVDRQIVRKFHKAGDDILRFDAVQILKETAVQFNGIHVQILEKRQGRVPHPKVVQGTQKAKLVHFPDEIVHPSPLLVIKDDGLSQLNFQDAVRNPILLFQRREGL